MHQCSKSVSSILMFNFDVFFFTSNAILAYFNVISVDFYAEKC